MKKYIYISTSRSSLLHRQMFQNKFANSFNTIMAAQRPARRLGSKTLSQALQNFVVPVVAKSYSVMSIRVLWDAKKKDEQLAECLIAMKRRQLEMLLRSQFQTMVIWTCITGIEVKKWKKNGSQTATEENRAQENVNDDEGEGEGDAENEDVEINPE